MNHYKVCIIGAGSIGATKDDNIDYPGGPNILTHAHAIDAHPQAELLAVIDTDSEKLMKAKDKWQPKLAVRKYEDIELQGSGKLSDIVIVSVPTEYHYETLIDIVDRPYKPKLVIAEKPFCSNLDEARNIAELYKDKNIPLMVDYIRRFAPGFQKFKKQVDSGQFGRCQCTTVYYTRGFKHECCHALDLMNWFFWKYLGCYSSNHSIFNNKIIDRDGNDPTIYAHLEYEKCHHVVFQPCDGRKFGIFEIDMMFEKARFRFIDNGLYLEMLPVREQNEWGHSGLSYSLVDIIRKETQLNMALYNLIDNAIKYLDGKEQLLCAAEDAVSVHEILRGIR